MPFKCEQAAKHKAEPTKQLTNKRQTLWPET
jgi:hypothetical protein